MWLCINDCFLSIVSKDCQRDELLVRARRPGDIEKIFPGARVRRDDRADYLFRAVVKRAEVETAMVGEVRRIIYANFKDSVQDAPLHDAYLKVWTTMSQLQPTRPFSGLPRLPLYDPDFNSPYLFKNDTVDREVLKVKKRQRRKAKKLRKGQ